MGENINTSHIEICHCGNTRPVPPKLEGDMVYCECGGAITTEMMNKQPIEKDEYRVEKDFINATYGLCDEDHTTALDVNNVYHLLNIYKTASIGQIPIEYPTLEESANQVYYALCGNLANFAKEHPIEIIRDMPEAMDILKAIEQVKQFCSEKIKNG